MLLVAKPGKVRTENLPLDLVRWLSLDLVRWFGKMVGKELFI